MSYDDLLAKHGPGIRADADKIAGAVKTIWDTAKTGAGATVKITQIFGALIPLVSTLTTLLTLDAEGKALVFAEAFDAAIGTEPTALVNEVMIFDAEDVEDFGDGIKKIMFKVFHRQFIAAEATAA